MGTGALRDVWCDRDDRYQGRIDVRRGLSRPEDRKANVQSSKKAGQPVPLSLQGADSGKGERAVHSERLMPDLASHRTAALQAALTDKTHVALALVVQRLVKPVFGQLNLPHGQRTTQGQRDPDPPHADVKPSD